MNVRRENDESEVDRYPRISIENQIRMQLRFFTETVDAGRISPLAFFEAGDSCYKDERFYWQNADKTLTLVGIGHAKVLTSEGTDDRFAHISTSWNKLCSCSY